MKLFFVMVGIGQNEYPEMIVDGVSFEFGVGGVDVRIHHLGILKEWKHIEARLLGRFL